MKKTISIKSVLFILVSGIFWISCSSPTESEKNGFMMEYQETESKLQQKAKGLFSSDAQDSTISDFIQMKLESVPLNFKIPAIQSPVYAIYDDKWILFGGRKSGLHNMSSDPASFQNLMANDSIWVIDMAKQVSYGIPIPPEYLQYLSASSQQHIQEENLLYVAGGFTYQDTSKVSNWTSDSFYEIDLEKLIQFVTKEGNISSFDQVINKNINDPFLQVTGGEMIVSNGNFYLVGGQKYTGAYLPGNNGIYTSAIKKFSLSQTGGNWFLSDTMSIKDEVNLHRRDFNLAEVITPGTDSIGAVIYGGVFTKNNLGYQSPIYLNGLASSMPYITVDSITKQKVNLYSSAQINSVLAFGEYRINRTALLGGITYMDYNADSGKLVKPSGFPEILPFSKLISSYYSNGEDETVELVQLPPNEQMPGFLGANAVFFANQNLLYGNSNSVIDLNKVFPGSPSGPVLVGYMYGGIESPAKNPRQGISNYLTKTNATLYGVYMTLID